MAGRYGSLYDSYRLSNSSVVPMYQGSAAPEMFQVNSYLQGIYDTAKGGANDILGASDSLQTPFEQDSGAVQEVLGKVQGDIKKMSESRDWENQVDAVRGLGRYYANRAMEIQTPIKQYQEYVKSLEDDKKALTPEQKQILIARSKAGYKGLQKDGMGRFTGGFGGVEAANNVDMPKWADSVMQGMKEFKGGTIVEYNNEKGYLVKRGDKREWVSPQRVQGALQSAMAMDGNVQAYLNMEGENAKFLGSRVTEDMIPDKLKDGTINPVKLQAQQLAAAKGTSFGQAYGELMGYSHKSGIIQNALNYVQTKYAYDNRETEQGLTTFQPYWSAQEKGANDPRIFGDLTTDVGVDLTKKYGDASQVQSSFETATQNMDKAANEVNATKNMIAKSLGVKPGDLDNKKIADWFASTPGEAANFGRYKASLNAMNASKNTIDEITALKTDAMDLATKTKHPGMVGGYSTLKKDATSQFQSVIKNDKVKVFAGSTEINDKNVDNYEVVDGDLGTDIGSYITVKEKSTGKEYKIQTKGTGVTIRSGYGAVDSGTLGGSVNNEKLQKIGKMFDGLDWKSTWKDAAANIRSNGMIMPLLDKATRDGQLTNAGAYATRVSSVIRASGGLNLKDADLNDLGDAKDIRTLISANKFDLLGITKVGSDGKLYAKLSVEMDKNASDPEDRYKTVYVAADTDLANKMGLYAQQAGKQWNDIRTYQFGKAMMPGSGYEQVLDLGTNGRLLVNDRPKITGQKGGKPTYAADSKPLYEIVTNPTGDPSAALTYEMYQLDENGNRTESKRTFTDAFDLGTFIDKFREAGATTKKNNKR